MTEAEALEIAGIFGANAITAFSVYITFTMAYLVAAYYAGEGLTPYQSFITSTLYLFAAASAILSLINSTLIYGAALKTTEMGAATPISSGPMWAIGMTTIMTVGILVSFYFMWSVRHPKSERLQ